MRRTRLATLGVTVTLVACVLIGGCGLTITGVGDAGVDGAAPTADPGAAAPTLPPADGGATADPDWPDASRASCTCSVAAPPGFVLVAFEAARATECPPGFATRDLVADPVAGAGACTCGPCVVTTPASCASGSFTTRNNGGTTSTSCDYTGQTHSTNGGNCTPKDGTLGAVSQSTPPAPTGGACGATVSPNEGEVTTQRVRACAPTGSTCACDPSLGGGFATCLRAAGDVACPAIAPKKRLVGAVLSLACGACTCSSSATTCSGSATFYADRECVTALSTSRTDGCNANTNVGSAYRAYRWQATANQTCGAPQATAPPSVTLTNPTTICCP